MTRIITITSGLPRLGKSHLGINAALELARKGHTVGYYHEGGGHLSINQLVHLPHISAVSSQAERGDVLCRGYQGIDIMTSRISLSNWAHLDRDRLVSLISAHEVWTEYDDFLIDTSGISPRGVVACCKLSSLVVLVVTPDLQSQAEAFALLKVLCLNGFDNRVVLIANQVRDDAEGKAIHARVAGEARQHLDMEISLLGSVTSDEQVNRAEQIRQAFSSVAPESEAAGQIVQLVDALESYPVRGKHRPAILHGFWRELADILLQPVELAGHTSLAEYEQAESRAALPAEVEEHHRDESTLLRFEGPLARLDNVLKSFSGLMQFIAGDMLALDERLAELYSPAGEPGDIAVVDTRVLETTLVTILNTLKQSLHEEEHICFQVEDDYVRGDEIDWLRAGHYIKYVFLVQGQGGAIELISQELEYIPDLRHSKGHDGECICEALSTAHDACLSVIHTPGGEIRVHYWHPPESPTREDAGASEKQASGKPGAVNSPAPGRLH